MQRSNSIEARRFVSFQMPAALACALVYFSAAAQNSASQNASDAAAVHTEMRNVVYHFTDSIVVHIRSFQGAVIPVGKNPFPIFDDKNSFDMKIDSAEIAISASSLANALNSYVFVRQDAPLKNIAVSVENGQLKVKGTLRKGDVSFEIDGTLTPTSEGEIRLHPEKIRALHLPAKGLMDLLGIDIADLIKNGKVQGVRTDKDDLILDPSLILPPPHIHGAVTAVRLEGQSIVQTFGALTAKEGPGKEVGDDKKLAAGKKAGGESAMPAKNFMRFRKNRLQFGKLLMNDTDMTLIDMDPADPLDFFLDHFPAQIAQGYTKITPSFGLMVYTKDYDKLRVVRQSGNGNDTKSGQKDEEKKENK
jgi:hypothetical protein